MYGINYMIGYDILCTVNSQIQLSNLYYALAMFKM